ncbi:hypothetical protein KKA53_04875 [Candidatus Dependentiae bacterium]|nr:hypothetical protein [Candidatus Dependentiae bacterium]
MVVAISDRVEGEMLNFARLSRLLEGVERALEGVKLQERGFDNWLTDNPTVSSQLEDVIDAFEAALRANGFVKTGEFDIKQRWEWSEAQQAGLSSKDFYVLLSWNEDGVEVKWEGDRDFVRAGREREVRPLVIGIVRDYQAWLADELD